MPYELLIGDVLEEIKSIQDQSVHCVITSPPYWNLRDYDNPDQIGIEETLEEYIDNIVKVCREVKRVLRDDGTFWFNIGDTYSNKNLMGVPWKLAFALQDDGWYLRQEIIWSKPNTIPESVTNRCTKSHEQIFLLAKSTKYYFDNHAIKEPLAESSVLRLKQDISKQTGSFKANGGMKTNGPIKALGDSTNNLRNRRSVWVIAVENRPSRSRKKDGWGDHVALFPSKLVEPCIKAGSSERGCCSGCGNPMVREKGNPRSWKPSCDCGLDLSPCVVLDPFSGSGTTIASALKLGRNAIGIELNPEYAKGTEARIEDICGIPLGKEDTVPQVRSLESWFI